MLFCQVTWSVRCLFIQAKTEQRRSRAQEVCERRARRPSRAATVLRVCVDAEDRPKTTVYRRVLSHSAPPTSPLIHPASALICSNDPLGGRLAPSRTPLPRGPPSGKCGVKHLWPPRVSAHRSPAALPAKGAAERKERRAAFCRVPQQRRRDPAPPHGPATRPANGPAKRPCHTTS